MKAVRPLILSLILAITATPAVRAAAPIRLFEVAVTRFTSLPNGRALLEYGQLAASGQLRVTESYNISMPPMPAAALGKAVISSEAWFAFQSLGSQALANFDRVNNGVPHVIAGIPYYEIAAGESPKLDVASVVNLSTRGSIAPGNDAKLIGGFVIHGDTGVSRRVLIRAIGPSLTQFGVTDAATDPFLSLKKGALTEFFNGNWSESADPDAIAAASAQVGAFPLARGSKDAAILIELAPGAYTAHVHTEGGSEGGSALLEVYVLP